MGGEGTGALQHLSKASMYPCSGEPQGFCQDLDQLQLSLVSAASAKAYGSPECQGRAVPLQLDGGRPSGGSWVGPERWLRSEAARPWDQHPRWQLLLEQSIEAGDEGIPGNHGATMFGCFSMFVYKQVLDGASGRETLGHRLWGLTVWEGRG